jgi:hypothetical protein
MVGKLSIEKESLMNLPSSGTNLLQITGRSNRRETKNGMGASEFMRDRVVRDNSS